MCLLDEVVSWDSKQITCRTSTHRAADNPLRSQGRLGAACGIEYAAQSMAVHGALVASRTGATAPQGLLASVRGVRMHVDRLDDIDADLVTIVERVAGDDQTAIYEFSVHADRRVADRRVRDRRVTNRLARNAIASAVRFADNMTAGGVVLLTGRAAIAFTVPR